MVYCIAHTRLRDTSHPSPSCTHPRLFYIRSTRLPELIAKLRKKYEGVSTVPAPAVTAAAPASPFGKPAGGGGLFGASTASPSAAVGPSPFGTGAGFGAPKPTLFGSGSGVGGSTFGQVLALTSGGSEEGHGAGALERCCPGFAFLML